MIRRYNVSGSGHSPSTPTDLDLREVASVTHYQKPLYRLHGGGFKGYKFVREVVLIYELNPEEAAEVERLRAQYGEYFDQLGDDGDEDDC